ncbi:MAG: T9SS type A sorting domain-containing protein [Ignavibacteria bacterium]|nr:T9SS type A sorting domain-containing protein [Ignavibacteria bacterium]
MTSFIRKIVFTIILAHGVLSSQGTTWEVVGQMPFPVSGAEAIVLDTTIYLFGGYSDSTQSIVDIIQAYYPNSKTWQFIGHMRKNRYRFVAEKFNDEVYIHGGIFNFWRGDSTMEKFVKEDSTHVTLYDTNRIFNRLDATGLIINQNLYIFGGLYLDRRPSARLVYVAEYNIPTKTVTYKNDSLYVGNEMPENQMSSSRGNTILVFGGEYNGIRTDIFQFNINSHIYKKFPRRLLVPRAGGRAVRIESENKIFILGGYNEVSGALNSMEVLRFGTDTTVTMGPQMQYGRRRFSAVVFNDYIYVFGGANAHGVIIPHIERYRALTDFQEPDVRANDFELSPNFPNPFNPTTTIRFRLEHTENISLDVFSLEGKHVANLARGNFSAGTHNVIWRADGGNSVASGIYIYTLKSNDYSHSRKMLLIR